MYVKLSYKRLPHILSPHNVERFKVGYSGKKMVVVYIMREREREREKEREKERERNILNLSLYACR